MSWGPQGEELVRTRKKTEQARGTHPLETAGRQLEQPERLTSEQRWSRVVFAYIHSYTLHSPIVVLSSK